MARFSRAYPAIELTVLCDETVNLLERIRGNEIDLAIITNCSGNMTSENFRQERLLWATSNDGGRQGCLAVVDMPDGADVYVRFRAVKFLFSHGILYLPLLNSSVEPTIGFEPMTPFLPRTCSTC